MRTIEEAITLQIPNLPVALIQEANELEKRITIGNESASSKIHKIYAFVDRVSETIRPFTTCKKGCPHCCYFDVQIATIEAMHISKNINVPFDKGDSRSSGHFENGIKCNFLSDFGDCSIYEYRPIACRTYFALANPDFCKPFQPQAQASYDCKSNIIFQRMLNLIGYLNGMKPIRDIRDFFPDGLNV